MYWPRKNYANLVHAWERILERALELTLERALERGLSQKTFLQNGFLSVTSA